MFIYTLCPTCIDSGRRSDGLGSGSAGGKHLLELGQYFVFEVDVELPDITELSEGQAAVSLEIVHARNPVVLHRRLLVFGVFAAIALDFDDEVQGIIVTIVYLQNDVRDIGR